MKRNIGLAVIFLVLVCAAQAAQTTYNGEDITLSITYNDEAAPGDAVVMRMTGRTADGRKNAAVQKGMSELFDAAGKRVEKSVFFTAPKRTASKGAASEWLSYLPLSTWQAVGTYKVRITVNTGAAGEKTDSVEMPFKIVHKDFISETIPLDSRNTSIKTDTSEKRMAQIKRLNGILGTVTMADVFTAKPFVPPVDAATRRSSHFGDRRVYQYTSGKSSTAEHYGIDYAVPTGTAVAACADGKVVMAEDRVSTGWSVAVEHAPGLYSLYYHMSALSVKEGQMVKSGDTLGQSGATGLATGPHLHWEVRLNMCAVSPDFWTSDYAFEADK